LTARGSDPVSPDAANAPIDHDTIKKKLARVSATRWPAPTRREWYRRGR
jgi:hypothetical protein